VEELTDPTNSRTAIFLGCWARRSQIATTTREAKLKSEGVVPELEKLAAREERRASQWPESFFA